VFPDAVQRVALAKRCFAEPGTRSKTTGVRKRPRALQCHRFARAYALHCVRGTQNRWELPLHHRRRHPASSLGRRRAVLRKMLRQVAATNRLDNP